jgi:hypothetical protein
MALYLDVRHYLPGHKRLEENIKMSKEGLVVK